MLTPLCKFNTKRSNNAQNFFMKCRLLDDDVKMRLFRMKKIQQNDYSTPYNKNLLSKDKAGENFSTSGNINKGDGDLVFLRIHNRTKISIFFIIISNDNHHVFPQFQRATCARYLSHTNFSIVILPCYQSHL